MGGRWGECEAASDPLRGGRLHFLEGRLDVTSLDKAECFQGQGNFDDLSFKGGRRDGVLRSGGQHEGSRVETHDVDADDRLDSRIRACVSRDGISCRDSHGEGSPLGVEVQDAQRGRDGLAGSAGPRGLEYLAHAAGQFEQHVQVLAITGEADNLAAERACPHAPGPAREAPFSRQEARISSARAGAPGIWSSTISSRV